MNAAAGPVVAAKPGPAASIDRYRILVVDDEPNVLSALQRSLRGHGYQVTTALGGELALAMLEELQPHAIISDMRMPGMNGAEFLKASRTHCPDTVRVLLTGYADINSALQAVNEGEIFRYLTKPWDDAQLAAALDEGLERHRLRAERDRLLRLTEQQNTELQDLNQNLESLVAARTVELQQALAKNEEVHQQLKRGFLATMNMFSSLVEARAGLTKGSARRVADHVRRVGPLLGLAAEEQQDATFAAMLVDLGKVVLPERLVQYPFSELRPDERRQWLAHPLQAASLMIGIDTLRGAAEILHGLHERFDGTGFPDQLQGAAIPVGARLLAVATDYEGAMAGALVRSRMSTPEAVKMLADASGRRYDPDVVARFIESLNAPSRSVRKQVSVGLHALVPGMQIAEDVLSKDGLLMLSKGHMIDAALIRHFHVFEAGSGAKMVVTVWDGGDSSAEGRAGSGR